MAETTPAVNQTVCQVLQVSYCLPTAACDRCGQEAPSFSTADRMAIDLNLDKPVLMQVTVSVHHCAACEHYFRAQPPFLRRDAIYTNRVVNKAVQAVYADGMAMRRVTARLGRDFWVQPSEGMVRLWCQTYGAGFDFAVDYQPWVVSEFSGILCVDEVYQNRLALLLAVDPAAPDGDRLVGYQLIHGQVTAEEVETFVAHLKAVGLEPDEVVTDGSKLYPTVLAKVWPQAAHQLCLFHETRRVAQATMKVINAIRQRLPQPPPKPGIKPGGQLREHPPSDDPEDAASQRWYWRQMQRRDRIILVHELAQQGYSQRAIARQTGHNRRTVRRWLQQPIPPLPEHLPPHISELASLPVRQQRRITKRRKMRQVHALAQEGQSYSAIARQVGIHRVTVKQWLQQDLPPMEVEDPMTLAQPVEPEPPAPWSSWDQVRQVHEALQEHRFLLVRRPENLNQEEQAQVDWLLNSPVGPELQTARAFLVDWYRLFKDEEGQRRSLADAQARYDAWRTEPAYRAIPQLKRIQDQMSQARFEQISQFLRHSDWEATNNGAERTGRAFRHRQAPHFNLRKQARIECAITVAAYLHKEAASQPAGQPFHTCQRGRTRKQVPTPA